jgi:phosphoribosylanthranilate isomerase
MVKVKICGITNVEDALAAESFGADVLGFVFTVKSPRYIKPVEAKKIIEKLGPFTIKCGVFMDQDRDEVLETASLLGLDVLQFHGEESAAYCKSFPVHFSVVKVLFPADSPFAAAINRCKADAYLFDIKPAEKSGSRKLLPVDTKKEITVLIKNGERVIISSGLTVENVAEAVKLNPYAVDVASSIEQFIGKKDHARMEEFIKIAKGVL